MEGSSTVIQAPKPVAEKQFKAKNLEAERRRRSKLNDRIYALRSLVPKITKMSKASAIDDAIRYIGELKHEVDELERELSQFPTDEDNENKAHPLPAGMNHHLPFINCQVEVSGSVAGCNRLDIKIVCENKASGFLKLLEALNNLGLEVTDINVAVFQGAIMQIFTVEGRRNLVVSKEHVKEWLLQVIGNRNMEHTFTPSKIING